MTDTLGLAGLGLLFGMALFVYMSSQQPSLSLWVRLLPAAAYPIGVVLLDVSVWATYAAIMLGTSGIFVFRWHRYGNPPMWFRRATDGDYRG